MDSMLVLLTVVSAVVYGVIFFVKAYATSPDPKPPFDKKKFAATLIVAFIIGVIAGMTGVTLNEADLIAQLGQYAGYVAIIETLLKAFLGKAWPTSFPES